ILTGGFMKSLFKILLVISIFIICSCAAIFNPSDVPVSSSSSAVVSSSSSSSSIAATYTITYNANGATTGTVPADTNKYQQGTTATVLPNSGSLMKTGYI